MAANKSGKGKGKGGRKTGFAGKRKDIYLALRREGASKQKAARIANAAAAGTLDHRRGKRKKRKK